MADGARVCGAAACAVFILGEAIYKHFPSPTPGTTPSWDIAQDKRDEDRDGRRLAIG